MSVARWILRAISPLVPGWRRDDWLEEWEAELAALDELRATGQPGYPAVRAFVAGALPHAIWMRKQEWSMTGMLQDLRYAARVLGRAPGFTLVAALTLAVGIGANASMFTLVNGLLLRQPPALHEPDRLVQIGRSYENAPRWDNWSNPSLREIERATVGTVFEGVAGLAGRQFVIGQGVDAESVVGEYVTGNYFEVLGVRAALGRVLERSDDVTPGGHPVVVLSHELWMRRFGGARDAIGRTLALGGNPYEIIGVAPRDFVGIDALSQSPQLYIPVSMRTSSGGINILEEWGSSWIYGIGRLAAGTSFDAAQAAMPVVSMRLRAASEINEDIEVLLAPGVGLDPAAREQANTIALLLTGIAVLVLLLTCANVANLFLARASARGREMGVRLAMGAGRGRVARQLLTESLLLAVVSAVVAYPIVRAASGYLPALFDNNLAWSLAPDARVLAALLGLGVLAGLLFGALPAIAAGRSGAAVALGSMRATGGLGHTRLRDALVVLQLAISLGLMTASALLGRSVLNAGSADPGFDARGLVVAFVNPGLTGRYDAESASALYDRLLSEVRALPGVTGATLASEAPFVGGHARRTRWPADRPSEPAVQYEAEAINVGPGYFETLGIPLLRGRTLEHHRQEPEPVAVINQAAADFYWPGEDAVGKELNGGTRVVGVVGNVQSRSLRTAPRPAVFEPLPEPDRYYAVVHVRTARPAAEVGHDLREAVAGLDPGLPVTRVAELQSAVAASIGETRTFGWLVAAFAGLAFVLSIIGLYGLVSYAVSRRVRELGIRIALGAEPGTLVRMVLRRGLGLAAVGIGAGIGVAWAVSRALQGMLFGVSATNGAALAVAALVLLGSATVAAWLPARRAGRADAVASLRES